MKIRMIVGFCAAALLSLNAAAQSKPFPGDKPIRLIVPFAAGGGVDGAARLLANQIHLQTGATVVVENRAGANGVLGGTAVKNAPPDGHTLLFSAATHVLAEKVLANPPYSPQKDFTAIAKVAEAPLLLITSNASNTATLEQVLAAMKTQGEGWTIGIPAAGAPSHLASLGVAQVAQAKPTYVSYRGTQPAATDVAGGHVNMQLDSLVALAPLSNAGRVKGVMVTSDKRIPLVPEIPTAAESGHPELTYASWYGVWAPPGLSPERTRELNTIVNHAVHALDEDGSYEKLGLVPADGNTAAEFGRFIGQYVGESEKLLNNAHFVPS